MKKKVGQNASAQRNHLYIPANFTFLTAQKPQEHAQVRGVECQKCATTGGGCRPHPVWPHLITWLPLAFAFPYYPPGTRLAPSVSSPPLVTTTCPARLTLCSAPTTIGGSQPDSPNGVMPGATSTV